MTTQNTPLPPGWKQTTLRKIKDSIIDNRGKTPPISSSGYELIEVNSIVETKRQPDYSKVSKFVDEDTFNHWFRTGNIKKDDILIPTVGTIGNVSYSKQNRGAIAQNVIAFRVDKNEANPLFTYYLLKSPQLKRSLMNLDIGGVQPSIKVPHLLDLEINIPQLPEQQAIAVILSSLDDKIELLREQNKTLESLAQTIFKEWFIKFNFPGSTGKMIDSELGPIPEGWRAGILGDEFAIIMGQSPDGQSYNENHDGMVFFQGRTDFQERFPLTRLYTTEPNRVAEKFDVLVSVRAPVGDINVADEKCCIGRGLAAVKSNNKSYALNKMLSLKKTLNLFEAEGTVFGSINKNDFQGISTVIPKERIVEQFEAKINPLDQKYFNNYNQIKSLSLLRDTLLPKLMSGKIRVKS